MQFNLSISVLHGAWCTAQTGNTTCSWLAPTLRLKRVKSKVLPKPYGPLGGADLHSIGPQPDTSLHCKDRGYGARVSHGVSVYSPAVRPVPNYTAWCEQLAQSCYLVAARSGSNSRPLDRESDALTTTPPGHPPPGHPPPGHLEVTVTLIHNIMVPHNFHTHIMGIL